MERMREMRIRKTKIVCTIGPSSESSETIEKMIKAGMDIARLNFSHGTFEEHLEKIRTIREVSSRLGKHVAILQDLSGPKIRIGTVKEGGVELKKGKIFILTNREIIGDEQGASVNYPYLPQEVKQGDKILLSDGTIELKVLEKDERDIKCMVVIGGFLSSHKGINVPEGAILASSFTEKDAKDLMFGIKNGVDMISLSYVKRASDIERVKDFLKEQNTTNIPIIAKIERKEALGNIDEILSISDGIMVARGDLGVETPLEKVPNVQKMLIKKANAIGKPVITATQMLKSMVEHIQPTRAEVTDVVNAIYDGTDAIMLSEETASGKYPVEAVQMMDRIALACEEEFPHEKFLTREINNKTNLPQAISHVASLLAKEVKASVIVTPTESGSTSRWVSRLRPAQPILALSRHLSTVRNLKLCWGVFPALVEDWKDTDDMLEKAKRLPKEIGLASKGDKIVIIAGVPISIPGTTNLIKVEIID